MCAPTVAIWKHQARSTYARSSMSVTAAARPAEAKIADGMAAGGDCVAPVLFGPVPRDNQLACEKGMEALREFSNAKTIVFKHG
jgi:hypothetical protein